MKQLILFLLLLVSGIASAQFTPTGSKTRFVNGIGLGTKSDAAFGTVDSLVLYASPDSTLKFKYKGTARALAYASQIPNDSLGVLVRLKAGTSAGVGLYANNWTQIAQFGAGGSSSATFYGFAGYDANRSASYTAMSFTDKGYVDSIGALKLKISDTATMLSPYQRSYNAVTLTGTQTITGAKTFSSILTTSSRVNINGASDNATYPLNVTGNALFSGNSYANRVIMNNSTESQGEFWGWSSIRGADVATGEIRIGGTAALQGRLIYSNGGNTALYLENTFDDATAEVKVRTRSFGTPVDILTMNATTSKFHALGTGTLYTNAGVLTNTNPSDSTLKNTIKPLGYGLAEVLKLKPKTFYYNSDSTKSSLKYGFIAQEVRSIMPDVVREFSVFKKVNGKNVEEKKLGLESDGIYVTLVKAIQEQQAIIDDLKKRIIALENK